MQLAGQLGIHLPGRGGMPRLMLRTADGRSHAMDCLAWVSLCTDLERKPDQRLQATVTAVQLRHNMVWPLEGLSGQRTLDMQQSRFSYTLYIEREQSLWRFTASLASALLVLAIWFGKRPVFPT